MTRTETMRLREDVIWLLGELQRVRAALRKVANGACGCGECKRLAMDVLSGEREEP